MEKITKQDLKSPDAFINNMQRLGDWSYEKRGVIIGIIAVIVLAAVVWAGIGTYQTQKEDKAQEALYEATKKLNVAQESFTPTEEQAMPGEPAKAKKAPTATKTGDVNVDFKEAVPALKDVIKHDGDTQAAVIAGLELAKLDHEYKNYDEEISVLNISAEKADHPVTKALAITNLGSAYEAKGDCNGAITQWQKIQSNAAMSPFLGDSLIKTALCYEKLNQNDKALATYQRFDDAEKEMKKITESMANEYQINPSAPPESQSPKKVAQFRHALAQSPKYQELQGLLSDRQAAKSAKKYMRLIKRGQAS
jgi:predicted negative regulator of RcsB-dependent stress response